MSGDKPYPNHGQSWLLLLMFLGGQFGGLVPFMLAEFNFDIQCVGHPISIVISSIFGFSVAFYLAYCLAEKPARYWLQLGAFPIALLLPTVALIIGQSVLLSDIDNLTRTVMPIPEQFAESIKNNYGGGIAFLARFLVLLIVAPITEELLFRGVILRGLLGNFSTAKAIFLSAVIFGAAHMNPWQFAYTVPFGVLLGWLYYRTQSLRLCILAHATNNALGFIASLLPWKIPGYTMPDVPGPAVFQPWWFDMAGIILFSVGLLFIVKHLRNNSRATTARPETSEV